jgi:beta-xylosidase
VWAPTIRYRDGVYYVVVTVMLGGRGCVVFTATDPAGPWSDGTTIPAVDGIDPDLAWDDDGTAYVTFAKHPLAIRQVRVDLATGEALEEPRALWAGSGRYSPEGPHLHRRGEHWYLLVAEGGTDRGHAVTVARGPSPEGPWENCPHNPVLTAAGTGSPVQNTGHADLVDAPDGGTALVHLGVRPVGLAQAYSPLGRETFLTAVDWVDGWPRTRLPSLAPGPGVEETFDLTATGALDDPGWLAVRRTPGEVAKATDAGLAITGDGTTLDDPRPWFVGRRQRHLHATVATTVDATAGTGGLACRYGEDHWFAVEAGPGGDVTASARLAGLHQTWTATLPAGAVELRMELTPPPSDFSAGAVGGDRIRLIAAAGGEDVVLTELDGRYWTFEVAKSFTGRVIGLHATDGTVTFADFRYRGDDTEEISS